MKCTTSVLICAIFLTGCAGMNIQPIPKEAVASATWGGEKSPKGYVVYHPKLVVEITEKRECGEDKECNNPAYTCAVGKPFYVPDLKRPYTITSRAGLGKAGMEVSIVDGWQLSSVKNSSDNTAFLSALSAAFKPQGLGGVGVRCTVQGLYTMDEDGGWMPLKEY